MPMMNLRIAQPDALIDLNGLEELTGIEDLGEVIRIGAMTRHVDLLSSPVIAKHLPLVARAACEIAHPAIRHRGTIGGSLALADPAAELPACALASDAIIHTTSLTGEQAFKAEDFFKGTFETALEPGALITGVDFPKHARQRFAFREIARRKGDYASVGVAITARGKAALEQLRIVLFGIATKPERAMAAEQMLEGLPLAKADDAAIRAASEVATQDIDIIGDLHNSEATKSHLAKVLVKRCLKDLVEEGGDG